MTLYACHGACGGKHEESHEGDESHGGNWPKIRSEDSGPVMPLLTTGNDSRNISGSRG